MPTLHLFFIFTMLCIPHSINSSSCSLDFSQFPYEAHGDCLGMNTNSVDSLTFQSCCRGALFSFFQSLAIRSNQSQSISLDPTQAQDCIATFQTPHNRTDLSKCKLQNFISSPASEDLCSKDIDSVRNFLGFERYNVLQSNCTTLSMLDYSDGACFSCVVPYRESLRALKESDAKNGRKGCGEALLVSLASADLESPQWVHGTFSCLWNEIEFDFRTKHKRVGFIWSSKKLIAVIVVAAMLVVSTPVLYKITRKRLQDNSDKEIEDLSVIVFKKTLEEETRSPFNFSDLYLFSHDELAKATNGFENSNVIGEGNLGKMYVGIMPSGMRAASKKINKGMEIHDFTNQICGKTPIRHPNLISVLGYCGKGDQCLVYEYCVNGDLASWLIGERRNTMILSCEQRILIMIGTARGLSYLNSNPLERMVHGDLKLASILLNERLEPKLSVPILSRKLERSGLETVRANDLFNFGVVLLQLLTGRKPKSLVDEARNAILRGGGLSSMADPLLRGAFTSSEFRHVLSVAILCAGPNEYERPNMEEILQKLERTHMVL